MQLLLLWDIAYNSFVYIRIVNAITLAWNEFPVQTVCTSSNEGAAVLVQCDM